MRDDSALAKKREEFLAWVEDNPSRFSKIRLTGGEVALMPEFYNLLDRLKFKNKEITILSNLNTNGAHLDRLISALQGLIDNGNTVNLRVSIDGIGAAQEWQRQNSNWNIIESNWRTFGAMDLRLLPAVTLTPLTLESMPDAIKWTAENAIHCRKKPRWVRTSMVFFPTELAPDRWYGCFIPEILQSLQSLCDDRINGLQFAREVMTWLQPSLLPDRKAANELVTFLDNHQATWGGDDWRPIYPKLRGITDRLAGGHEPERFDVVMPELARIQDAIAQLGNIDSIAEEEYEG